METRPSQPIESFTKRQKRYRTYEILVQRTYVYASAHDNKTAQVDSVRSQVIPMIKLYKKVAFRAVPNWLVASIIIDCSFGDIVLYPDMNYLKNRQG